MHGRLQAAQRAASGARLRRPDARFILRAAPQVKSIDAGMPERCGALLFEVRGGLGTAPQPARHAASARLCSTAAIATPWGACHRIAGRRGEQPDARRYRRAKRKVQRHRRPSLRVERLSLRYHVQFQARVGAHAEAPAAPHRHHLVGHGRLRRALPCTARGHRRRPTTPQKPRPGGDRAAVRYVRDRTHAGGHQR